MESGIVEGLRGIINKSMDCKKALVCLTAQALMLKNRIQGSKNLRYLCVPVCFLLFLQTHSASIKT